MGQTDGQTPDSCTEPAPHKMGAAWIKYCILINGQDSKYEFCCTNPNPTQAPVLRQLYTSTCVSRHLQLTAGGFCWCAKFYGPHALADGNQCNRIREKTLEFSSTVSSTLSPYLLLHQMVGPKQITWLEIWTYLDSNGHESIRPVWIREKKWSLIHEISCDLIDTEVTAGIWTHTSRLHVK